MTPMFELDRLFEMIIQDRQTIVFIEPKLQNLFVLWYTNGSETYNGMGRHVYGPTSKISVPLDTTPKIFWTEILAIEQWT